MTSRCVPLVSRELSALREVYEQERMEADKCRRLFQYEEEKRADLEALLELANTQKQEELRSLRDQVPLLVNFCVLMQRFAQDKPFRWNCTPSTKYSLPTDQIYLCNWNSRCKRGGICGKRGNLVPRNAVHCGLLWGSDGLSDA